MMTPPPVKYPRRRHRRRRARATQAPPPPPVALTLVAATYAIDEDTTLTLTFDRAIDIGGLDGTGILVRDGDETHTMWDGTGGAALLGPAIVRLTLNEVEADFVPGIVLTAGPASGIVATDDGGTWGGANELPLPFP